MKTRMALLFLGLVGCFAATGCTRRDAYAIRDASYAYDQRPHPIRQVGGGDVYQDTVTGEILDPPPVQVVYVPVMYGAPQPPPEPAPLPRVTAPDPTHATFDQTAALEAIHAIDLSECAAHGAPKAYAHARVTFDANGHAKKVAIDEPIGLSKEAVDCLGQRIGHASVPAFEGSPVTIGAGFYVR